MFILKLLATFPWRMLCHTCKYPKLHLMLCIMSLPTEKSLHDFSSLLDANNTISLSDSVILAILHAHTRGSVISNFCLPHTFALFSDLDHYLSLYWRKYTNMDNTVVGHPMGKLQRIQFLNCHGLSYDATTDNIDLIISIWQKYEPYSEFLSYIDSSCMPGKPWFNIPLYSNWSTANIKIPYRCSTCNALIP